MIKELCKTFTESEDAIQAYFGYKEDWKKIPIEACLDDYWMVSVEEEDGGGFYVTSTEPFTLESLEAGNNIYAGRIYTQRFLPKYIYRKEDFTMVSVDTQTDGNKFLYIFDNSKECTDPELIAKYRDRWWNLR